MTTTRRYRSNVSTSVKGIKSPDCTVEITSDDMTKEEILEATVRESTKLTTQMNAVYVVKEG